MDVGECAGPLESGLSARLPGHADGTDRRVVAGSGAPSNPRPAGGASGGPPAQPLQRDCVLAISRGGRYTLENVVPACASCNTSKCNEEVTAWLRRTRRDERAFLLRYAQLRKSLESSS